MLPAAIRARMAADAAAGMTLQAIADALDTEAVPTARGGRWYSSTVRGGTVHPDPHRGVDGRGHLPRPLVSAELTDARGIYI
jgi:hypothetical protein